jgi:hypothetical protein
VTDPCLVTPIHEHRDGDFILPLLQSRVGIFLLVVVLVEMVECHGGGWHRHFVIRFGCGVWCVGLRG